MLRCDQRPGDLAGGNGIHRTTVTRWVREVVGLLAARAPRLGRTLKRITRTGGGVVLLDGSLIRARRRTGTVNRKNYSGKHKHHGLLVIALTDGKGRLLWVSAARRVRTSEITGYKAARNRPLTRGQKLSNRALAAVRAPVEHGFAHLKNWRVLGKVRTDPKWATALVRTLLVLTNREVSR
ncbi:transposase family protein [Streptomyces phaeochromogenes]|uniref:transposase family protein n=1 Tax=Streptomyces phaeochromogenes TaxID=1923 RepID=UPI001FE1269D|nr:transposase family protein [Streptomyces phaeochromogenes]